MRRLPVTILALTVGLAACDHPKKNNSVAVDMGDADAGGHPGEVRVDMPGFQGSFKLPRIKLGANDLDMNGLKLYPGSTIRHVDMDDADANQQVQIGFASPAAPPAIRQWFVQQAARSGFALHATDAGMAGTTLEHKPLRIDLTADGPNATRGVLHIGT